MFTVIVSPAARAELLAATIFLEQNRSGYGEKFANAYEDALKILQILPYSNRIRYRKARALGISGFSYLITYKVYKDSVFVQKLVHMKRSVRKQYKA